MVCPDRDVLARYLSDEAGPREADDVRLHADTCPDCRQGIEAGRAFDRVLGQIDLPAPVGPGACLDAMTLAALLDGGLPEAERGAAVDHVARCGSCLDDLVSAAQRSIPALAVPDFVAARARTLGREVGTIAAGRPRVPLFRPLWQWAAVLGAVMLAGSVLWPPAPPPATVDTGARPGFTGKGFEGLTGKEFEGLTGKGFARQPLSARSDVQAGGVVRVDAALARALRRHGAEPTPETRAELLRVLEEGPLRIPAARVAGVEIRPEVLIRVAAEPSVEARVLLLEDGRLVVEEP
jgi:hypothetical protein